MGWIGLRTLSFLMVQKEQYWDGLPPEEIWTPRNQWNPFDPFLLAEGKIFVNLFIKLKKSF